MWSVVQALQGRAESLGFPVYVGDASGASQRPYVLLLPPGGAPHGEQNLSGDRRPVRDAFMVRAVGQVAEQAVRLLGRTRDVYTNVGRPITFDTADGAWRVHLARDGSLPVTVDRDVTFTGTGGHPVFVTDEYTLTAVPI